MQKMLFESNTENGGIEMDSLPETAEPLANVKFQVTKMEQGPSGKMERNDSIS